MSLLWAAVHHPHYEVGHPWEGIDPAKDHVTPYDSSDKVHPSTFGLPHRDATDFRYTSAGYQPTAYVPTHTLQAAQPYVYEGHVRNLASLPPEAFDETHDSDPIRVWKTKDGHHLINEGTHRSAAALLRGDSHVKVNIEGTEA